MSDMSMACWSMALWADKKYGTLWYRDFTDTENGTKMHVRRYVVTAGLYPVLSNDLAWSQCGFTTQAEAENAYADELRELYNKANGQ